MIKQLRILYPPLGSLKSELEAQHGWKYQKSMTLEHLISVCYYQIWVFCTTQIHGSMFKYVGLYFSL